jgi:peptidoglycan/LPS O-acetylase OafA/YrhL
MKPDRIVELDVLKGISIFGVLVIHSSFEGRFDPATLAVQAKLAWLFDWAVLGFFFSSGVLHKPAAPWLTTAKKRAVSLLLPFCLYNVIYNLIFVVLETAGCLPRETIKINFDLLLTGAFQSPAFQLYFLPYLFLITVGIGGAEKIRGRGRGWTYATILFAILGFYLCRGWPGTAHGPEFDRLPIYLAAFILGVICKPVLSAWRFKLLPTALVLVFVLGALVILKHPVISLLVPPLVAATASAFPFAGKTKPLLLLGGMSGSIYLWHTPLVLPAATRMLAHLGVPSMANLFAALVLTLGACVLLRYGLDAAWGRMFRQAAPKWLVL